MQEDGSDMYWTAYDSAKQRHLSNLLAKFSFDELVSVASSLRDGMPCSLPGLATDTDRTPRMEVIQSQMGGQNCHVDIKFQDGVFWIARIRLDDPMLPPKPVQSYILQSEFATLKYLERTSVRTPKIFHRSPENEHGVAYILMEKMSGSPLNWEIASPKQKSKVMEQLADVYLELEKHPFAATGSLIHENGTMAGFAQAQLFKGPTGPLGPFDSLKSSLDAILRHELDLIGNGEVTTLAVDNYLSHCWRLEMMPELLSCVDHSRQNFYLKHMDDKGDHILVDEDYNITGIIDWEFASAEVKEVAFSSPCMAWPVGDFYDGSNELSAEEVEFADIFRRRGRVDLSQIVRNGRKFQRFFFFLGGLPHDRQEFEGLFQGLRHSFASHAGESVGSYSDWRSEAIEKYSKDDERLQRLLRAERSANESMAVFRFDHEEHLA